MHSALVLFVLTILRAEVPPQLHDWTGAPRAVTEARYVEAARAVASEAADDHEPRWMAALMAVTLARESYVRADVMACAVPGLGGVGAFQLAKPRRYACSLPMAARLAHEAIRESLERCGDASGYLLGPRCSATLPEARRRWERAANYASR